MPVCRPLPRARPSLDLIVTLLTSFAMFALSPSVGQRGRPLLHCIDDGRRGRAVLNIRANPF